MKYSARRTWPEKSKTWEYLGEAESLQDFALAFATDKKLEVGAEFVVIEKAGAESEIEFFKVTRASPYGLATADPRVDSEDRKGGDGGDDNYGGVEAIASAWRGVIANIFFFMKVGGVALAIFLAAIFIARWAFDAW